MSLIRRSALLAVAALAIGLVACEEMAQKPPATPQPEPVALSRDQARDVAEQAQLLVQPLLDMLSSPASLAAGQAGFLPLADATREHAAVRLEATAEPAAAVCVTSDPQPPVDGDEDGIPLTVKIAFDCSESFAGISFSGAGTVVISDKDDANPDSGFRADIDARYEISGAETGTFAIGLDGTLDVTQLAATGTTLEYDIAYDGKLSFETPGGRDQFSYAMQVKHEGTFAAGVVSIAGTFGYSWDWDCSKLTGELADECRSQVQSVGSKGEIQLTIKAIELEYDTVNCETAFTRGALEVRDDVGNVAQVRYAGCGQETVTYNGELLE